MTRRCPATLMCVLAMLVLAAAALAQDGPVAAWSFNGSLRRMHQDVAGQAHHAIAHSDLPQVEAPGLQAVVFDGLDDYLQVPDDAALQMTDAVTVDLWLMLDEPDTGQPQCVVDKAGERYRIQVSGTTPMLGLKSGGDRLDLSGGRLTPGRWHRVTGVFERPNATLYVDGEQVAAATWEHDIGPGGDLIIGSKAGTTYFFRGKLDELRIYNYARPPQPDDVPSTQVLGVGTMANARLRVEELDDGVRVDTGMITFELTQSGALRSLAIDDHAVVAGNTEPLPAASVLQSAQYDGWCDYAPGQVIEATCRPGGHAWQHSEQEFSGTLEGRLDFGDGDALGYLITVEAAAGSPFLTATVSLSRQGDFQDRFLRDVSLRLPLALNLRKRVVQAGDRGVQWNTRHFYQFHVAPTSGLMNEPDHNIWRRFAIDQDSAGDYHIWKAESTATPALTMQRGLRAPGWMATYDERAGLIFAYRGMPERAPKSLRVLAADAGEARICLWHDGLPALHVDSPQAEAVFGAPHIIDVGLFTGEFTFAQPDVALANHWRVDSLSSDPPDRNEPPLGGLNPLAEDTADAEAPLVSGGVPLPQGAITDPANVRLQREGADVPLQTRALGYWPDGSIKWLLLTFPPDGGRVVGAAGDGDELVFRLTRRDGSAPSYVLRYGGDCRPGTPAQALSAAEEGDVVRINTGELELELAAQAGWLRSVRLNGRDMLSAPGGSFVDFLRTEAIYASMTTHPQGSLEPGPFVPESIELEEGGPLRAVVKLTGATPAQDAPRMVIRLEAWAGRTCARVVQSVEFQHVDPRPVFVRRMGLELPLAGAGDRVTAGGQDGPMALSGGRRAGLRQHSHLGYQAWSQRPGERFVRIDGAHGRSRGWLDLSGPAGGVAITIRDMWQQFPTELLADIEGGRMVAYFWPESLPLMDVRRYSNYPHRAQGESTPASSDWVPTSYYQDYDGFRGISKTHELLLYFHGPQVEAPTIDAVAGDFQRRPLVYCGADWYLRTRTIPPQPAPGTPGLERMEANLQHYAGFWMAQQRLWGWYGCWDYGDVRHLYKSGYGRIVPADRLVEILADPPEDLETINVAADAKQDYAPPVEWAYDNGRWGWTNTEGLPGLYMQIHYLRTGDPDAFFFAEAMARHVRDVDMRHAGRWLGYGTRHGVQHWSDGNHEERQTTHSEFRHHYFLTGEPRSRDFARLLFEQVYSQRDVSVHAAHSGRLQGLLTWWEMTGDDEVASILERYIPCFIVPEGICIAPSVDFPDVTCVSQDQGINEANMFFWVFGAGHALIDYYELTGHEGLRAALIRAADAVMARGNDPGVMRKVVAFAALHAPDPQPYRDYLAAWAARDRTVVQVVAHNPEFYGASRAFLRGSVPGSLFLMNDLTYLMAALGSDPALDAGARADIARMDAEGGAPYIPPLLSWQSEYDRAELEEYLRIKHPQP
ncbi:MAG: LamG-like jellyroll fold domain-containing protein [Armatimonadota bacterium]